MEFIASREDILRGLSKVQSIVERRNTMPILSNALIKTGDSSLEILATDLEVSFSGKVPAQIKEPGSITVSAKKLFEIIREFPESEISFKKDENNWLNIKCENINFKVVGLPADEFPSLPEDSDDKKYSEIKKEVFKDLIDKTIFAVSNEESRVNLGGVYIEKNKGEDATGIKVIATDGHRLSLVNSQIEMDIDEPVIIPKKGIAEIRKILDDSNDGIKFKIIKNNCLISTETSTLFIRLIDETFPNYMQVLPKNNELKVEVNKDNLLKSLKRISLLSTEKYKGVKFHIEKGIMTITSNNSEFGEAKETLNVVSNTENVITIGLNAKYIIDVLNATSEESVVLELKDEVTQCMIKPKDNKDYISVIMPMRL